MTFPTITFNYKCIFWIFTDLHRSSDLYLQLILLVFVSHHPDSTVSYTETVPPLFSSPPHILPTTDYTGEYLRHRWLHEHGLRKGRP